MNNNWYVYRHIRLDRNEPGLIKISQDIKNLIVERRLLKNEGRRKLSKVFNISQSVIQRILLEKNI